MTNKTQVVFKQLFLLGLFFLPLVFWPWAEIAYELPRVWFVQRWVECLILGGVLLSLSSLRYAEKDNRLLTLVSVFGLVALGASWLGIDWHKSWRGNYYRGDGLFTLFHLIGFFYVVVLYWDRTWSKPTATVISLGAWVTSLWSLRTGFQLYLLKSLGSTDWGKAVGASFGQPNFLAGYLVVSLPLTAYLIADSGKKRERCFWLLVFGSLCGAILLTLSRGGVLGVGVFGSVWLLDKVKRHRLIPIGLIVTSVIFGYLWRQKNPEFIAESRERIFRKGLLGWRERPLVGWGWANFDYAFEATPWPIRLDRDVYVDKAHSSVIEVLVTTGIVGLIIYLIILGRTGYRLLSLKQYRYYFLSFVVLLAHAQTNVISIGEEVLFWLFLGMAGSCRGEGNSSGDV